MILRLLLLAIFLKISLFSCAGYWDPNEKEFIFLENRSAPFANYSKDLNDASVYNEIIWEYDENNKKANLQEWQLELKNKYTLEELESFIYKRENLNNLRNKEVLDYIKFVEKQEDCVTNNFFSEKPKTCNNLISKALEEIEQVQSNYLKLRYFYLAFRLAHYEKKDPLKIYEKYKFLLDHSKESILKDWVQGIYAGAILKNTNKVQGVYEFSKLLDENKINYHLSYYNFFHIKKNEEFNELLNLAKNQEEKTKFYFLRSLDSTSNTTEELQNIYNTDKNSKWFDTVLYRELLSSQVFFNVIDAEVPYQINHKLIDFLNSVKKDDMYMINLSLAYFNLYDKNYKKSLEISNELLKTYPKSHEAQVLSYVLYLNELEKVDIKTENDIFLKLTDITKDNHTSDSLKNYTFTILEKIYQKQYQPFDAFLMKNALYFDLESFDLTLIDKFKEFMNTKQDSKLKEYLKTILNNNLTEKSKFDTKDNLETTKLFLQINELRFEDALKNNSTILETKLEFNPFNGLISGNNRSGAKNSISIKDFLQKLVVIKSELEKNPKSVSDNYLFANALFNLSYFGNSDKITTLYRSVSSVHTPNLQKEKLDLAIKHYEVAINESNDKELKAKLTYLLAKAKLALFDLNYEKYPQSMSWYPNDSKFNYGSNDNFYEEFLEKDGGKYFDNLRNNYKDTKYYKELIKSCGDFKTYQNSKK